MDSPAALHQHRQPGKQPANSPLSVAGRSTRVGSVTAALTEGAGTSLASPKRTPTNVYNSTSDSSDLMHCSRSSAVVESTAVNDRRHVGRRRFEASTIPVCAVPHRLPTERPTRSNSRRQSASNREAVFFCVVPVGAVLRQFCPTIWLYNYRTELCPLRLLQKPDNQMQLVSSTICL